ncbi:MAG: TonB-dependent receptor [Chitinophagaceae bacterium]
MTFTFLQQKSKISLFILCLLTTFMASAQSRITGKVIGNGDNLPTAGAAVLVKGTSLGTSTDSSGSFSINAKRGDVLVISSVGYLPQEIIVASSSHYSITLSASTNSLTDVVVTGYTSQKKKDITGSVSVVDMKSLKTIPTGSAVVALQGQAAGVNIISSGAPNGSSNIFIRGISSFGDTRPLVLVDGVESNLDQINANEIESVQVLKDAGAAAIYGVRGSNGVIIVTTKKGKPGAPTITYDAFYKQQVPLSNNPFNLLKSADYARLSKIAYPTGTLFANGLPDYIYKGPGVSGTGKEGDAAVDPSKYNFDVANPNNNYIIQKVNKTGTDWFDEVFNPAPMTNHNLTASGGTDRSKYLFSVGYLNQQGTLIETFLKRYSARINTEFKIGDHIRIGENAYWYATNYNGFNNLQEGSAITYTYRQMPIIPVYDIKGNFGGMFGGPDLGNSFSPVAVQNRTLNNRNNTWMMTGNAYAEVDFLKHFTIRTSFGGSVGNNYFINFAYNRYNDAEGYGGLNALSENSGYTQYRIWTNTANYTNTIGKHSFSVLAGTEAVKYSGRNVTGSRSSFFSNDFNYLLLGNGNLNLANSSSAYNNTLFSLFGRLDYSYGDRYLVGLTIRRDGSSKFGSDNRYGVFPSVSLGWRVSEEAFMKDVAWLNDFKLRGSYGILGSQSNIDPANAFTVYGSAIGNSYYDINGTNNSSQQGFYQTRNGNVQTGWEKDIITNFGFDATILNNKIDLSVEYYKKTVNGLLFPQPLPATAGGAAAPVVNIGDIQNTGFDISANYHGHIGNDVNFVVGANITTYKNDIVSIPGSKYFETSSSRFGNIVRNQVGQPVSSYFGYDVIGLFQSDQDVTKSPKQDRAAPGRFKYRDVNGDGAITPNDRTFIGNPNPDFTYGVNMGVNVKNVDLSAIFYGSQGNDIYNLVKWYTHFFSGFRGGRSNDLLNAWTPENTKTNIPKIENEGGFSTAGVSNSFYIEDGSFLKLRSLMLGYKITSATLDRYKIKGVRLYAQAANLFQITKYSGLDPELGGNSADFGIDRGNYPNNEKSFVVGLNLSF